MPEWTITGPDGIVEDFSKATVIARLNDISPWTINDVPTGRARAVGLLEEKARVRFRRDDTTILSGPVNNIERICNKDGDVVNLAGFDDKLYLRERLAHPQPGSAAPSGTPPVFGATANDAITGPGSTVLRHYVDVNAGPSAVPSRRVPGLTIAADPVIGGTLHFSARWLNLLDVVRSAAVLTDIAFDIVDLQLVITQPADRTGTIKFSFELGNLAALRHSHTRPAANFVNVLGGGEGTARVVQQGTDAGSVTAWGLVEGTVDRRDTTDLTELSEAATKELLDKATATGLSIAPIDTTQMRFGEHYNLGDKVTVIPEDGIEIQDRIREIVFTLDEHGETVAPGVGDAKELAARYTPRLFNALRDVNGRTTALETI